MVFAPEHYTAEQRWVWSEFFWQRQPTLDERELADFMAAGPAGEAVRRTAGGSSPEDRKGAAAPNRYLFSSVGAIEPLALYTTSRARLVLLASLPLLVVGLVLIYFPAARHPAALFVLAVLVAAASLIAPQSALLLGQASALGLALVVVAALLARLLPRTAVTPTVPGRGSSFVVTERSVTELYHRGPSTGSSPPSTSTEPLVPASPEVQS